jgi:hydrogenase expression/formation protein HypE
MREQFSIYNNNQLVSKTNAECNYMEEGKLPLDLLGKIIKDQSSLPESIIQGPQIGADVAVVDYYKAVKRVQDFYKSKEKVYLVYKTDPITFPTPDPGKYSVIVNSNDVVTSGALPFGFNATIILPVGSTSEDVIGIQRGIQQECDKNEIIVLGGHTEFSSSVNTPVVSGAMLGFVPKDYYVTREIKEGDLMLCVGWCAKEGVGIIANEGFEQLSEPLGPTALEKLLKLGDDISIVDIALKINKEIKPGLMHDATEGGILGAAYETISPMDFGLELYSEKFPLTKETIDVCLLLDVDPLKIISSGTLLVVTSESKAKQIMKASTKEIPIKIIGKITSKDKRITLDGEILPPPGPDAIIDALRKLEEGSL